MKIQTPVPQLQVSDRHVAALKALANESRLRVFFHLAKAGGEVPAGEIAERLDIPGPTLSRHLDLLTRAGLVRRRREERYIYYAVTPAMTSELVRLLSACC